MIDENRGWDGRVDVVLHERQLQHILDDDDDFTAFLYTWTAPATSHTSSSAFESHSLIRTQDIPITTTKFPRQSISFTPAFPHSQNPMAPQLTFLTIISNNDQQVSSFKLHRQDNQKKRRKISRATDCIGGKIALDTKLVDYAG